MQVRSIREKSIKYLENNNIKKTKLITDYVLSYILQISRINLYGFLDNNITDDEKEATKSILKEIVSKKFNYSDVKLYFKADNTMTEIKKENIEIFEKSISYLKKYKVERARLETEYIFSHVLGVNRLKLKFTFEEKIEKSDLKKIKDMLLLRGKKREPFQYLANYEEFYGNKFYVDKRVLIPRSETEILVHEVKTVAEKLENPMILDIGCGSGSISISLGKALKNSKVLGLDICEKALEVANKNKIIHKVENVKFIKSNIFSNVKYSNFDIIVSNPPYISEKEYAYLIPEVKEHEPKKALVADNEGNFFYKQIIKNATFYLKKNGILAFELGYNQKDIVMDLMQKQGYRNIWIVKDLQGIDRVILGIK